MWRHPTAITSYIGGIQSPNRDWTTVIDVPDASSARVTTISVPAHGSSSFVARSSRSSSRALTVASLSKPGSQSRSSSPRDATALPVRRSHAVWRSTATTNVASK